MSNEISDFIFRFGTYPGTYGNMELIPWTLNHVTSVSMNTSGQTSLINTVGRPARNAQIFDTGGSVRTITISGFRYDFEEEVSNWDFLFNEFNRYTFKNRTVYSVGLDWYDSRSQTTLLGYYLSIFPVDADDERYIKEDITVAFNGFTFEFLPNQPGAIEYTINLVERRKYGNKIY